MNNTEQEVRALLGMLDSLNVDTNKIKVFIETGSHRGHGSIFWASIFNKVYSIELSEDLYSYCVSNHNHINNLKFYKGSSPKILENLINEVNEPYFLFLDAHGSGGDTTFDPEVGRHGSPVLDEIKSVRLNIPKFIVIDDYIDFINIPTYPKLNEIEEQVKKIGNYSDALIIKNEILWKGMICFKLNEN
jgi:hypothetical protein